MFKVIVSEKTKDTVGDYLELLGYYNPHTNKAELKADRVKHWIEHGAQASGTVHNLLVGEKIIAGEKIKVANIKKKQEENKPAEPTPAATKEAPVKPAAPAKKEAPVEKKEEIKEEPKKTEPPAAKP